jgi:hypothetical protein
MIPVANRFSAARNRTAIWFPGILGILAFVLIGFADARAQQPPYQEPTPATLLPGIETLVTPYLFIPWTGIDIRPANTRISSASSTIDPAKLISHLTWVPFMGQVEIRNGPFGFVGDFIHAPVKSGISTRNILFGGGTGKVTIDTGSGVFLYRPIASPDQYVDIGVGFRVWGVDGQIALNPQRLQSVTVSNGFVFADPLIAARYHRELGNGFGTTLYGDLGGFGVGAHFDWQLTGTIDYAMRPGVDLHAGFRSLNFSYGGPRANFNVNMYGPVISATFRF